MGGAPRLPRCDRAGLDVLEAGAVVPAFGRRALVSDIMTWHYETPERLACHLEHDRKFISWIAARSLNAFSYIRHTVDSRLKIDELSALCRERGIASEYGGHVLPLLLPRGLFGARPDSSRSTVRARAARAEICVCRIPTHWRSLVTAHYATSARTPNALCCISGEPT